MVRTSPAPRRFLVNISLKDIARELGISTAAASRALNDLPGVSDELRVKVKETAQRLGYQKYLKASLVNAYERSMKFIVVLYGHVGGGVLQELQQGIDLALRKNGYNQIRYRIDPDRELQSEKAREVFVDRIASERGVVGVLACYFKLSDVLIDRLQRRGLPVVLLENQTEFGRCVTINQVKAAYKAVMHLAGRGRRRIGCILPPEAGAHTWQDRLNGYRAALKRKRLRYDPSLLVYPDWVGVKPGELATRALIRQRPDVDAILYGSDTLAAGGLKALRESGKAVPSEVTVIGFDDEEFAVALQPALSTIRQPIRKLVEAGLNLLMDSIRTADFSHRAIDLETELVIRES